MKPMTISARIILILSALLLIHFRAEAQNSDVIKNPDESGWIENMSGKIALDVSFNNSYKTFEVETSSNKILLYPNNPNNLRLKFNYEFISLGIQFTPEFLPGNGDNDLKGATKSLQLGTSLMFRHWFSDIRYTRVRGYYLRNTDDFNSLWTAGDPFIQFPDLHYKGISVSSGYIQNSNFSLRSLTTQTERQLKSAGSFMPVFNLDYYVVNDKSDALNTQKSNNIEFNIGPGYAHTFVFKERLYASLGLSGSIGYINTKLNTRTGSGDFVTYQGNFLIRGDYKAGMGFNGKKYYSGLFTTVSGTQFKQENTTAINTEARIFYHFFFGMRFNAPQFLKGGIQKIKSRL